MQYQPAETGGGSLDIAAVKDGWRDSVKATKRIWRKSKFTHIEWAMRDRAIVHFLYEPGDGGLDRVAIYLANGMVKRGVETELWLTNAHGPLASLIAPEITVRIVPTPNVGARGVQLLLQIPALAKMIRHHRPRAIFSAGNQSNLSIAIARQLAGSVPTKIIQKITNPIERPGPRGAFQWFREWRFGKTAAMGDKTFVLSDAAAKNYAKRYPKLSHKFVMAHLACVTEAMMEAGRQRLQSHGNEIPQLLAAGRLAAQKDYPVMLNALAMLKDKPWRLTIVGDGPERKNLEAMAKNLEISDRIDFRGFVADPVPYFVDADLLLLSSRWEGLGAVAVEAYACGCPVVATDCCDGLTEIIRAVGHETTPVGDQKAFAGAILDLLEHQPDIQRLFEIATPYQLENAVEEHLQLLQNVKAAR